MRAATGEPAAGDQVRDVRRREIRNVLEGGAKSPTVRLRERRIQRVLDTIDRPLARTPSPERSISASEPLRSQAARFRTSPACAPETQGQVEAFITERLRASEVTQVQTGPASRATGHNVAVRRSRSRAVVGNRSVATRAALLDLAATALLHAEMQDRPAELLGGQKSSSRKWQPLTFAVAEDVPMRGIQLAEAA